MTRQFLSYTIATCFLVAATCAGASADEIFRDDFSDGSVTDDVPVDWNGNPVRWSPSGSGVQLSADTGDLVLDSVQVGVPTADVDNLLPSGDVSLRSQAQVIIVGGIGFVARGHWAFLSTSGTAAIGRWPSGSAIDDVGTSFRPAGEELFCQFDAIGGTFSLWIWSLDDPMPAQPVLRVTDTFTGDNTIRVAGAPGAGGDFRAIYRFVHVADIHIPEPSAVVLLALGVACLFASRCSRI